MHPRTSLPGACPMVAALAAGCGDGAVDARTRPAPGAPGAVGSGSAAQPSDAPEAATSGSAVRTTGEDGVSEAPATRVAARDAPKRGSGH